MKVRIAEAEKLTGKSIKSIYRHISQGILTCSQNAQGQKVVDIAELERVYGKLNTPSENGADSHENGTQEQVGTLENLQPAFNPPAIREESEIVNLLHARIESLETQLARANQHLESASSEKASLLRSLENHTLMLPKPQDAPRKWWQVRFSNLL